MEVIQMTRLSIEDLSIGYGDHLIVKNLSLVIPDKKITTIIGPNGCGKSTLLKAMTRIIPYRGGSVLLDGKDIIKENTKTLARKMAILPQTPEGEIGRASCREREEQMAGACAGESAE